jgi:hypothetical protein
MRTLEIFKFNFVRLINKYALKCLNLKGKPFAGAPVYN